MKLAGAIRSAFAVTMAAVSFSFAASAVSPYSTYEYSADNYNGEILSSKQEANAAQAPEAFAYSRVLNSMTLKGLDTPFNAPEDFVCDSDGYIYVADTLNNRIVMTDRSLESVAAVFTGWSYKGESGAFTSVKGLFIREDVLYACLQDDGKIISFSVSGAKNGENGKNVTAEALSVTVSPDMSKVTDDFSFKPVKCVVDDAGRLYVMVQGTYDGLVSIDRDNKFLGFVGANKITMSLWDRFWRSVSSEKQIEASADTVPVEFYSIDIDSDGFIYTTSKGDSSENLVRKLNLIGNDVIKTSTHYIRGDISTLTDEGEPGTPSNLVDINVYECGIYSCLDNARGRVFTYDNDGNLLFAFGGLSAQKGAFSVPSAVSWIGDNIAVLDKSAAEIVIFSPTEYGTAVLDAVKTQYSGDYGESWELWQKVKEMNPNNEIANRNVGKLEYDSGNYKEAMECFKAASDTELYSKAYKRYRAERMSDIMPYIAVALAVCLAVFCAVKSVRYAAVSKKRFSDFKEMARQYNLRRIGRKG